EPGAARRVHVDDRAPLRAARRQPRYGGRFLRGKFRNEGGARLVVPGILRPQESLRARRRYTGMEKSRLSSNDRHRSAEGDAVQSQRAARDARDLRRRAQSDRRPGCKARRHAQRRRIHGSTRPRGARRRGARRGASRMDAEHRGRRRLQDRGRAAGHVRKDRRDAGQRSGRLLPGRISRRAHLPRAPAPGFSQGPQLHRLVERMGRPPGPAHRKTVGEKVAPRPRAAAWFAAALALLLAVAQADAQTPRKITLAYSAVSMTWLPVKVAVDKGFFREEGLEPQLIQMRGNIATAALATGDLDFSLNISPVLNGAIQGLGLKLVCGLNTRPLFSLVVRPEFKSAADLKGKAFAVSSFGNTQAILTEKHLQHLGLKKGEYQLIALGATGARAAALEKNIAQGSLMPPPSNVIMENQGYRLLGNTAEIVVHPIAGLGTHESKIRNQPEMVRKALRA